jgi:hypothetical protein
MGPEAYKSAAEFGETFRRAMPMCAAVLVAGAVLAWTLVRSPERAKEARCHPECKVHCGVTSPPLDPGARGETAPPSAPEGRGET